MSTGIFCIGGVPIHAITFEQALDQIEKLVRLGKGGYVVTPNVDHIVEFQSNREFKASYQHADLVLADGMPILWASHLIGPRLPQKISGSDLIEPLMRRAAQCGFRVYLLGTKAEVAALAKQKLCGQIPGLQIVGMDSPYVDISAPADAHLPILDRIRAAKPDIVLMALGSPKQEIFVYRYKDQIAPAVSVGIGAGLDFIAGSIPRAPRWISNAGLEWLYRLGKEPRRLWRRYLVRDPKFALILLEELLRRKISGQESYGRTKE